MSEFKKKYQISLLGFLGSSKLFGNFDTTSNSNSFKFLGDIVLVNKDALIACLIQISSFQGTNLNS